MLDFGDLKICIWFSGEDLSFTCVACNILKNNIISEMEPMIILEKFYSVPSKYIFFYLGVLTGSWILKEKPFGCYLNYEIMNGIYRCKKSLLHKNSVFPEVTAYLFEPYYLIKDGCGALGQDELESFFSGLDFVLEADAQTQNAVINCLVTLRNS